MRNNTRIYFAHSMSDYNMPYEDCSYTFIEHFLDVNGIDHEIFDPSIVNTPRNDDEDFYAHMARVFLPEVKKSDVLMAVPEGTHFINGKDYYSGGVEFERKYADSIGIPTFKLPHIMRASGRESDIDKLHILMGYTQQSELLSGISPDDLPSWDSIISQI